MAVSRHQRLKDACDRARERTLDLAESKLVERIHDGDTNAIKFMLETLGKNRGFTRKAEGTVQFQMPPLRSTSDIAAVMASIMQAASEGKVTLSQAIDFCKLLETYTHTVNSSDAAWPENLSDEELSIAIEAEDRRAALMIEGKVAQEEAA